MPQGSFASEVAAVNANRGEAPAAPAETPAENNAENTEANPVEHFAMPVDGSVHPEQQNDSVDLSEVQKQTPTPAPSKEGKIRIGNEVFDSAEDALAYATELQLAITERDAFEKGKQSVSKIETPVVEPDWTDEIEKELFENPKEAIKKIHQKATEDAKKIIEAREVEKEQAVKQETQRKQTWQSFYESNSDLSTPAAQEVVNGIMQRDWKELGPMSAEKALPLLAQRSRAFIQSLKETQLPQTTLQSKTVVTTKSGAPATTTTPQKKSSPLDFISQVNKHRRRTDTK